MNEYGMLRIRRKILLEDIHAGIKELLKDPIFEKHAYNTGNYIDDEGYVVIVNWKLYIGKNIYLTFCRNMKNRISMIHIRYRNTEESLLEKLVEGLEELTGGKFHKSR